VQSRSHSLPWGPQSWLWLRITGLLLVFAVGAHIAGAYFLRGSVHMPQFQLTVNLAMIVLLTWHATTGVARFIGEQAIGRRQRDGLYAATVVLAVVTAALAIGALVRNGTLAL
jgi:succinate dehydrogenase hydrophobic anchor subunit